MSALSRLASSSLVVFAVATAGCDDQKPAAPSVKNEGALRAVAPAASAAPAATAAAVASAAPAGPPGTVHGSVNLTGKAPLMEELKRSSDPFCAKTKMNDQAVVENKNHTLKNVIVRINGAAPTAPPAEPVVLSQDNCMYNPRVLAIVAGQTLQIKTGDPVLHNIHTYKGASTVFNVAQVPNAPAVEKKFTDAGALLKLKCDVHQWMTGWVWVQNNSYFAVTGDDGSFTIKGVPSGEYEIEAWQERLGSKKAKVVVAPGKTVEVKFDYTGSETAEK